MLWSTGAMDLAYGVDGGAIVQDGVAGIARDRVGAPGRIYIIIPARVETIKHPGCRGLLPAAKTAWVWSNPEFSVLNGPLASKYLLKTSPRPTRCRRRFAGCSSRRRHGARSGRCRRPGHRHRAADKGIIAGPAVKPERQGHVGVRFQGVAAVLAADVNACHGRVDGELSGIEHNRIGRSFRVAVDRYGIVPRRI